MHSFKAYCKAGEATACTPLNIMEQVTKLPIFNSDNVSDVSQRVRDYFQSFDRWEYVVTDDEFNIQAVLVFYFNDYDLHKDGPTLVATMAFSLQPNLLASGYRWMKEIAKEKAIQWIELAKLENQTRTLKYLKV